MKIKSALATSISGSIGGITGSHNRGGLYLRARRIPTNPSSPAQVLVRAYLATATTTWATLSNAQRADWELYAANVPVINPLGDSIHLSGQQWFVKCNSLRLRAGKSVINPAPTVFALEPLTAPSINAANEVGQTIDIAFTATDPWANEVDGGLSVQIGLPQSPGIGFYKTPFRWSGTIDGAATPPTSPATINSPFALTAGQKVWARVTAFGADARISPAMILGPATVS